MLNKNDPLIQSVQKVMEENNIRREAEKAVNEELGIFNRKALPFELHKLYDSLLEEVIQEALNEKLVGNQHKIDVNKNNRVDAHDFKLLRSKKKTEKKPEEHGVEAEREMASKGEKMYESDSDTYKAQNLYDKAHSQATKSGKSEKEAHAHASAEMKKKYPNHTASSSGEGQVYRTPMKEGKLDELSKKTLGSYVKGAEKSYGMEKGYKRQQGERIGKTPEQRKDIENQTKNSEKIMAKRSSGMELAKKKLAKEETLEEKRGLWDNIHAKRKRIAAGSGEKMRKPGSEGAPTEKDLKAAQNESAPPGAKYERMVKHIKKGYSKDGLTDKEKSIAYATAWKAKNKAKE